MNNKSKLSKRLSIMALLGCTMLVAVAQPSQAFFKKKVVLGTSADYGRYFQSIGQLAGTHPNDRNDYCQWKYGRDDVYGEEAGVPWMKHKTRCFYYK
jgi:hypothetical protein